MNGRWDFFYWIFSKVNLIIPEWFGSDISMIIIMPLFLIRCGRSYSIFFNRKGLQEKQPYTAYLREAYQAFCHPIHFFGLDVQREFYWHFDFHAQFHFQ